MSYEEDFMGPVIKWSDSSETTKGIQLNLVLVLSTLEIITTFSLLV